MRVANIIINQPGEEKAILNVALIDAKNQSILVHVEVATDELETTTIGHVRKLALEKAATVALEAKQDR